MLRIEELVNEIKELENRITDLQNELEFEKQKTEIEYSFKNSEKYFVLCPDGCISDYLWDGSNFDKTRYSQGNMFKTEEEAAKERDRRALLKRFRQFRDKCNGDWKPDWEVIEDSYNYYIEMYYGYGNAKLRTDWSPSSASFNLFGYFKKQEDCNCAIQLFGDEIKRLFVEE